MILGMGRVTIVARTPIPRLSAHCSILYYSHYLNTFLLLFSAANIFHRLAFYKHVTLSKLETMCMLTFG